MEKLSVVIATISDSIATNFTLAQIIFQLEQGSFDYEIILVDNGSSEEDKNNLKEFLRFNKEFPIQYYEYDIKGTIPPHSFGVEKAIGKYIVGFDPHVVISPNWFTIMIETLNSYQDNGYEVIFSPFGVGSMTKKGGDYIAGSDLIKPNPFGRTSGQGQSCKMNAEPYPVLSNSINGFISTKEWLLKIGNMFSEAFIEAGGHTAESLLIGIPTWMWGKKCLLQSAVAVEHPIYRVGKGAGWSASMHLSMATGAYILGGEKYLAHMPQQYGQYAEGQFDHIRKVAENARRYVEQNAKISLDELMENWEKIRYV